MIIYNHLYSSHFCNRILFSLLGMGFPHPRRYSWGPSDKEIGQPTYTAFNTKLLQGLIWRDIWDRCWGPVLGWRQDAVGFTVISLSGDDVDTNYPGIYEDVHARPLVSSRPLHHPLNKNSVDDVQMLCSGCVLNDCSW